jgi:hypothetical protein
MNSCSIFFLLKGPWQSYRGKTTLYFAMNYGNFSTPVALVEVMGKFQAKLANVTICFYVIFKNNSTFFHFFIFPAFAVKLLPHLPGYIWLMGSD